MESEKLGPRDRGPHLAVASVSSRVPAALSETGGPAVPAPPPRSPPPTAQPSPAPKALGLAAPCASKRPPSGGLGPLPNRLAYQGSALCFLPEQKVGTQKLLRKGLRSRARSEIGVESRNRGRKSIAEDLCGGEGVGPESFWPLSRTQHGELDSGTPLNGG